MLPQLRARLSRGMEGLLFVKRLRISSGGMEIWWLRDDSSVGMVTECTAWRARVKKASGARPEQVPWVCHS